MSVNKEALGVRPETQEADKKATETERVIDKLKELNCLATNIQAKIGKLHQLGDDRKETGNPSGCEIFFPKARNLLDDLNEVLVNIDNSLNEII